MPNHRNVYISLATSMSKAGKFQLTPLVYWIDEKVNLVKLEEHVIKLARISVHFIRFLVNLTRFSF